MLFKADFKSGQPVYLQLISQVRLAVASGGLRPGETLPSIGSVAGELRINRNHVAKAYSELESLGIIELITGKGYALKEQHRPQSKSVLRASDAMQTDRKFQKTTTQQMTDSVPDVTATTLYLLLAFAVAGLLLRMGWLHGEWFAIAASLVIAGLFHPLRSRIAGAMERLFFPKRRLAPRLLRSLKAELGSTPDLSALLERIAGVCQDFLGRRPRVVRDHGEILAFVNQFPALRAARGPVPAGNDLFMPLFSHDELIAVLDLRSERNEIFSAEDKEFLIALGEQFADAASQLHLRNERIESEYALEIQRGLLPRAIPEVPGFTIAGAWQPAKNVGGDYYDVFRLNEDEIALIIADVSGKGAPAALLMSNVQATTKAYASSTSSPQEVCRRVNAAICSSITPGRFITFFYAVLDTRHRTLTYCNAGHNPPLVVPQQGAWQKLEAGGTVLGLFAEAEYQESCIELHSGDRLVLFTDGVIEAADAHEREFGDDRLFTAMTASANTSAGELRDSIMQAVTHFCRGDFADDATLLVVTVNATSKDKADAAAAK